MWNTIQNSDNFLFRCLFVWHISNQSDFYYFYWWSEILFFICLGLLQIFHLLHLHCCCKHFRLSAKITVSSAYRSQLSKTSLIICSEYRINHNGENIHPYLTPTRIIYRFRRFIFKIYSYCGWWIPKYILYYKPSFIIYAGFC